VSGRGRWDAREPHVRAIVGKVRGKAEKRMLKYLSKLAAVGMLLAATSCAQLEPVQSAKDLADSPIGREEPREKKFDLSEGVVQTIAVENLVPAAKPSAFVVEDILRRCPIPKEQDMLVTELSRTPAFRALLVQTNKDLKARYNRKHDEVVYVYKGQGIFILGLDRYVAKPGKMFVVPKKMVYRLEVTGERPFVMLVTEIPPLGTLDRAYVRKPPE